MTQKLNQVLAVERQVKSRAHSEITRIHKTTLKPALFNGFSKTYKPNDEDGERFPPQTQRVQQNVPDTLHDVQRTLGDLFDITATKDAANRGATADLVVDGETLAKDVPATTLLFLEKQLNDLHTFVQKLPVLDPAHEWVFDENASLWKTAAIETTKSKKVAKPIVLYPATDKHPAQTQLTTEDVTVGTWTQTIQSGAIPAPEKATTLTRIESLQKAIKFAREQANQVEAPKKNISNKVFTFLFGK